MTQLRDAVVILTGAAGGIGRATARLLLDRGATVIAVDRDAKGLAALAELGDRLHPCRVDLLEVEAFGDLVDGLRDRHGRLDVLINNAGITVHGRFAAMSIEQIDRVLDVDLRAPLHLTRAVLPHLAPGGHVAFVSSMAGLQAFPTQSTYSGAKFGLRGFAAALEMELERDGLSASTVLPGAIATPFLAGATSQDEATTARLSRLMLRFGTPPERVARALLRGIERGGGTRRVGWDCHLVAFVSWICPPLVPWVLRQVQRRRLMGDM